MFKFGSFFAQDCKIVKESAAVQLRCSQYERRVKLCEAASDINHERVQVGYQPIQVCVWKAHHHRMNKSKTPNEPIS